MKRFFARIRMIFRFATSVIKLIRNPYDVSPIFKVAEFRDHLSFQIAMAKAKEDKDLKELFDQRYRSPKIHDLKELANCSEGSLGRVFSDHMNFYKMEVEFYPEMDDKTDDDLTYLRHRARETHDIHHAILGIKPDLLGEMKISGYYLAQLNTPLSSALIGIGFLVATIKKPYLINHLMNSIMEGWNMGKNSKNILSLKCEEMWDQPISEIRESIGVIVEKETYEQVHQREIEKDEKQKALDHIDIYYPQKKNSIIKAKTKSEKNFYEEVQTAP